MLTPLLLALAAAPPLPVAPGSPATAGTAAAQVIHVSGLARAMARPPPIDLKPGTLVDATELVSVGEGAWVTLLLLANGHLVRLDDALDIRVSDLALYKAPPSSISAEQQLNALLSAREQKEHPVRLMGLHAGLSGANTRPTDSSERVKEKLSKDDEGGSERARSASPKKKAAAALDDALFGEEDQSPRREPPAAPPPPPGPAPRPAVQPPPPAPGAGPSPKRPEPAGEPTSSKPRSAGPAAQPPAPAFADVSTLEACLRERYAALAPGQFSQVTVELKLVGAEARVRLSGGFPVPACAKAWAQANAAKLGSGWTKLDVTLTQ